MLVSLKTHRSYFSLCGSCYQFAPCEGGSELSWGLGLNLYSQSVVPSLSSSFLGFCPSPVDLAALGFPPCFLQSESYPPRVPAASPEAFLIVEAGKKKHGKVLYTHHLSPIQLPSKAFLFLPSPQSLHIIGFQISSGIRY